MMERGQVGEGAKVGLFDRPSVTMGHEEGEMRHDAVPGEDSADADAFTMAVTEPEVKADDAPNGTEVFAEWKEGPHRIIERRTGPGEEVCLYLMGVQL
jgi:hypothetical protein